MEVSLSTEFEMSAPFATAVVKALKRLGRYEAALAAASPPIVELFHAPSARAWWPGALSVELTRVLVAAGGPELVRDVGRVGVTESISTIVRPLVNVVAAISGLTPASMFNRLGQLSQAALKNVSFSWTPSGPTSGQLIITYPIDVLPEYRDWWLGTFDYIWALTRRTGRATKVEHHGGQLTFELSWD